MAVMTEHTSMKKEKSLTIDWRKFIEDSPDMAVVLDSTMRCIYANRQGTELLSSERDGDGGSNRVLKAEIAKLLAPKATDVLLNSKTLSECHEFIVETGVRRFDALYSPIPGKGGKAKAVMISFRDISSYHIAESGGTDEPAGLGNDAGELKTELTRARHFISDLLNTINILLVLTDVEGRILFMNRSGRETIGCSLSKARNRYFYDVCINAQEKEHFKSIMGNISNQDTRFDFESRWVDRRGNKYAILWTVNPVVDGTGKIIYITVSGMDITSIKQFERLLNYSRKKEWNFFEISNDIYFQTDLEGKINIVSPSVRHYGFEPSELIGHSAAHHFVDQKGLEKALSAVSEHGFVRDYETELHDKKGSVIDISINAHIMRSEDGRSEAVEGVIRNIIERKMAERETQRARDEFLTILTHDLKSPLSSIMSSVELFKRDMKGTISDEGIRYLGIIRQSGDLMYNLINNIVGTSRIDSGKIEYAFEDIPLRELYEHIRTTFEPMLSLRRISMHILCSPALLVRADNSKLRQIFLNLVVNAIRYTPHDGSISLSGIEEGNLVHIEVRDTGRGIPPSDIERIFEKYTQGRGERKGSGLGLYIVKKFLEGHGSLVRVESELNKGAAFKFTLPSAKSFASTRSEKEPSPDLPDGTRLLLIDNDGMSSRLDKEALKREGIVADCAQGALDGLQKIERFNPSIVVINENLPDLTAEELVFTLKLDSRVRDIPVVLLTKRKCIRQDALFNRIIKLPIEAATLIMEIKSVLEQTPVS
jgi:two-component system, OmpR family, sensor histidine kinase VicK